jgi:hypothetical protein
MSITFGTSASSDKTESINLTPRHDAERWKTWVDSDGTREYLGFFTIVAADIPSSATTHPFDFKRSAVPNIA